MILAPTKYLRFRDITPDGRLTEIIAIESISSGQILGSVKWYGAWRQYVFYPTEGCLFNVECLSDISRQITKLMDARRRDL